MSRTSALCPPRNKFSKTTMTHRSSRRLCCIEHKKVTRCFAAHLGDVDRARRGPNEVCDSSFGGGMQSSPRGSDLSLAFVRRGGLLCVLGQKRGASSVLGRRSHTNRGSNAHKSTGGSVLVLGQRLLQQGESLGAQTTLVSIGGASWCSADAHFKRRSLSVLGRCSFPKRGASWCSTNAHFDRRSILVLRRSTFR